jgi:uncharacterized membrane protein
MHARMHGLHPPSLPRAFSMPARMQGEMVAKTDAAGGMRLELRAHASAYAAVATEESRVVGEAWKVLCVCVYVCVCVCALICMHRCIDVLNHTYTHTHTHTHTHTQTHTYIRIHVCACVHVCVCVYVCVSYG